MMAPRGRLNPHEIIFTTKKKGYYAIRIPDWMGITGLEIDLDAAKNEFTFVTGLNLRDSGSSGPLAFGGPEMTEIFDTIYFPD
jgi:hypothetical protein